MNKKKKKTKIKIKKSIQTKLAFMFLIYFVFTIIPSFPPVLILKFTFPNIFYLKKKKKKAPRKTVFFVFLSIPIPISQPNKIPNPRNRILLLTLLYPQLLINFYSKSHSIYLTCKSDPSKQHSNLYPQTTFIKIWGTFLTLFFFHSSFGFYSVFWFLRVSNGFLWFGFLLFETVVEEMDGKNSNEIEIGNSECQEKGKHFSFLFSSDYSEEKSS